MNYHVYLYSEKQENFGDCLVNINHYSNGAIALLLKLLTTEKCSGGNWLFKSNCEQTVWSDDLEIKFKTILKIKIVAKRL